MPALLVLWLTVIYLPFAMRNWRSFLALCAAYLLMGIGVRLGVANFTATDVPGVLVMIGNFWIDLVVWALPIPIIARAVVLAAKSLGLSGARLIALNVVGFLALPGTWVGIAAYERWDRRPAPAECIDNPIALKLGGIDGSIPWSSAIHLYLGPNIREDGRYLFSPSQRRSLCRQTSNGSEPLSIAALSIDLMRPPKDRCRSSNIQPWEQAFCAVSQNRNSIHLPQKMTFFDPNGIQLGDFGIPTTATIEGYPLMDGERLVSASDSELGNVSAICLSRPFSDGSIYCQMRRPISDVVDVYWAISARPDAISESLLRAEAFASSVCSGLFDLSRCRVVPGKAP